MIRFITRFTRLVVSLILIFVPLSRECHSWWLFDHVLRLCLSFINDCFILDDFVSVPGIFFRAWFFLSFLFFSLPLHFLPFRRILSFIQVFFSVIEVLLAKFLESFVHDFQLVGRLFWMKVFLLLSSAGFAFLSSDFFQTSKLLSNFCGVFRHVLRLDESFHVWKKLSDPFDIVFRYNSLTW